MKQHTPEETHATPGRRELLLPAVVSRTVRESLFTQLILNTCGIFPPALEWAPEKPVRYAWICDMETTSHGTLLLTRETMKSSEKLVSHSGRTHPHSEGISPVTYMLKQTGPFLEWTWASRPLEPRTDMGRATRGGGWGMEFYLP